MNFRYLITRWVLACGCEPNFEHCDQCDGRRRRRTAWNDRRKEREARELLADLQRKYVS